MTYKEYLQWFNDNITEYEPVIIRLGYKYDFEKQYSYSNVYYYPDFSMPDYCCGCC